MHLQQSHQANVDARRSLGVRPGAQPRPNLRINDSALYSSALAEDDSDSRPASPRSPIISLIVPSQPKRDVSAVTANASGSGEGFRRLRRPTLSRKYQAAGLTANRGQYETQKLLSHLLDRLEARPRAPDLLDRAALTARQANGLARKSKRGAAAFGEAVAAAAMGHKASSSVSSIPPEEDEEELNLLQEGVWNIDATFDMVEQMRNLLVLAEKQSLDLFGASQIAAAEAARAAATKGKGSRFSSSPLAKTTSNASDPFETVTVSGPELLKRMAETVRSLLTIDCLYKATKIRPMQPPYALQAVCLDIAAVLYHKGDLKIQLAMMEAVVDGLYSMGDVLREKVCEWLEGRLAEMLHKLAKERGEGSEEKLNVEWNDPFAESPSPTVPTFAFSLHPGDETDAQNESERKPGWMRFSPTASTTPVSRPPRVTELNGILSTHTASGSVSAAAIQIAAIVPHILVAVTSTVDLRSSNLMTIYRVHRLISLVFSAKPDAALDLLEIIAHGPVQTRSRALDLLATFYPECVGHNVIARRPALATYQAHRAKWESGQERVLGEDDIEGHTYIPWRTSEDSPINCAGCHQSCVGFCVQCTLCFNVKHAGCLQLYQEETFQYNVIVQAQGQTKPSKTEVVHIQFSKCTPRLDEKVLDGGWTRGTVDSTVRRAGQHLLHLINIFNITLCAECHEPLWGATAQGYACMGVCQRFFHVSCADAMVQRDNGSCRPGLEIVANPNNPPSGRDPFSAAADDVRASFQRAADRLYRDPDTLSGASYDEISVIYGNLWIQLEILNNGIASGSLRIHHGDNDEDNDITGLQAIVARYKGILDAGDLSVSQAVEEFAHVTGESARGGDLLWRPRYLQYCAALLRAPSDPSFAPLSAPSGLLTVDGFPHLQPDPPSVAYEAVQMSTIRQTLAADLNLHSDLAASILTEQMRHLGLCNVANAHTISVPVVNNKSLMVNFPLPQLMDSSPSVELLVLAIEQLLDDIDLTANEQGFSLLFNRAWPSSMCSPYALERLGGSVMSWIMAEDDVLHHIVKNYASKRKRPPGVRNTAASSAKGLASVASYKDDRGLLLTRYARPWLQALHNEEPVRYAQLAYDRSKVIDDRWGVVVLAKGDAAASQMAGMALERITTLADANVTFSVTLDLLTAWLEDVGGLAREETAFKALPRLLRHTRTDSDSADLWTLAHETSRDDANGLQRVCRWLRVLACSGVEVPWESITALMDLDSLARLSDIARFDLVMASSANTTPIAIEAHAELVSRVFSNIVSSIEERHRDDVRDALGPSQEEVDMLRTGMLSLLRAYEVTSDYIGDSALYTKSTPRQVASHVKKKSNMPLRTRLIPLDMDAVLAAAKLLRRKEYPAEMTLDFVWLLLKAPAADNPDGFLHHICSELYESLWPLYDRPINRRSRARLFLKVLTINSKPIEALVRENTSGVEHDVIRERLFSFVLELADDRVTQDVSSWRRAAVGLIFQLFNAVMPATDPSPHNMVMWRGLLPTHLRAITLCFEDHLEFGNDEQRLTLLSQLLHLQTLIPSWPILGWHAIEQTVSEQVTTIQRLEAAETVLALAAVGDAWTIRAATLSLGMNMLAASVPCPWMVLQRFQQHAAAACDQPWPTPCDSITSIMLPALKNVLDSPLRVGITQDDDRKKTALVGSLFVSVVINFASDLVKWDFVVQRHILDILLVVFFKHNVQSVELQALAALQALASYASEVTNTENGILALQVLRTAQARMSKDKFSRILPLLFVHVADISMRQSNDGDSAFIDSCRSFLQESLSEFGSSGLLLQVLRSDGANPSAKHKSSSVGQAVQLAGSDLEGAPMQGWLDQLFRDLPEMLRWGRRGIAQTAPPLAHFTGILKDALSEESAQEFGAFLSRLGKQASEWDSPSDFDPNPIIRASAAVLKLAPAPCGATLLHQTSTFLQMVLSRYSVFLDDIATLVAVAVNVARLHQTENTVATVIFEQCGGAINGQPVTALTLTSLLEFLARDDDGANGASTLAKERQGVLVEATRGSMNILLRSHPTMTAMRDPEKTMKLLDAAAAVIVRAEVAAPGNTGSILHSLPSEVSIAQVHVFGHILYGSLPLNLGWARGDLVSLYPVLARSTALTMFAWSDLLGVPDPSSDGAHFGTAVFIVMRLAILSVRDPAAEPSAAATEALASFWRRLWPEWDRLLSLSLAPTCANPTLRAVTHSTLLDIIMFVASAAPMLLVDAAPLVDRGLRALEEWDATTNLHSSKGKLTKALAALDAVLRGRVERPLAREAAAKAIRADMMVTERLWAAAQQTRDMTRERERERAPTRMAFR